MALVLVLLGGVPWAPADSGRGIVRPTVRAQVARDGRARVLAELRVPAGAHVPEGHLSQAAVVVQRHDIATAQGALLARLRGRAHRLVHQYDSVPLLALEIGPDALSELEASAFWVKRVVEDSLRAPSLPQSVRLIGADRAWSAGFDGTGTVVAIVDTGVQSSHPFLAGKVVEEACYSSTVSGSSVTLCPNGSSEQTGPGAGVNCPLSVCWHGTHVAGIAAGNGAGAGVAFSGVAKGAQIMAVQVFSQFNDATDCGGSPPCALAWTSDIIAGLQRVYALQAARPFSSVNLSFGGGSFTAPCDDDPTKPIIDNLRSVSIATVVAAGNAGSRTSLSAPGCISSAISVGATTKSDVVASFSNVASFLSLLAPGQSIESSVAGGGFGVASGTSMAAPHVTGAWAILRQATPDASVGQILSALQTTGVPITDSRAGGGVTKPRISVANALAQLSSPTSPTLSVSPASVAVGGTVTATWSGIGAPTSTDWIGLYLPGSAETAYLAWIYVSCSEGPTTAMASGACPFAVPGGLAPGTYELRLFANNGYTALATSGSFTVSASTATLSASPSSVPAAGTVTATWNGIATPTTTDWIGLYLPDSADTEYLTWIYVSCSQSPTAAAASGSCPFSLPSGLASGAYELRLFTANGYTRLAVSNGFSVTP